MRKIFTLVLLVLVVAGYSFPGIEWTSKITTEGKNKKDNNTITAHIYAQEGDLKQVFEEVSNENDFYMKDGYWLFKSGLETIYIVNDKEKSYVELSLDSLLQLTGAFGKLIKIKILDHSINSETLPKETVNGYSCNHIKITTDYTMQMKIILIKQTVKVHEVKEIWATSSLKEFKEINASFLKKDIKTGFPDLDEMVKEQMAKEGELGFPLKVITHTIQSSKKGKEMSDTTTTMEVTNIASKTFPKSFFEIPADYKKAETADTGGKKKKGIF